MPHLFSFLYQFCQRAALCWRPWRRDGHSSVWFSASAGHFVGFRGLKNENLCKENRQVGGDSLQRTASNSSTEGSSDGSSNIGCHFTKNFMKESLESVVPASPPLLTSLRASTPSSGDSSSSSPRDCYDVTPGDSPSDSASSSSSQGPSVDIVRDWNGCPEFGISKQSSNYTIPWSNQRSVRGYPLRGHPRVTGGVWSTLPQAMTVYR